MSEEKKLVRAICVDTLTQIQENQYMLDSRKSTHDKWKDYATELYAFITELQNLGFEIILVLGPPGTGKSSGLSTMEPGTCIWYNVDKKNPVWTGGKEVFGKKISPVKNFHMLPTTYGDILSHVSGGIAAGKFEEERYAILTGHTENFKEGNITRVRLKTLGNLANKMQVEGKMEIVLYSAVQISDLGDPEYVFETQNNGYNTCRSPQGLFEGIIPNDYQFVIDKLLTH